MQLIEIVCDKVGVVKDVIYFCIDVQEGVVKFEGFVVEKVNGELIVSLMLCYDLIIFQGIGFQFNDCFWGMVDWVEVDKYVVEVVEVQVGKLKVFWVKVQFQCVGILRVAWYFQFFLEYFKFVVDLIKGFLIVFV